MKRDLDWSDVEADARRMEALQGMDRLKVQISCTLKVPAGTFRSEMDAENLIAAELTRLIDRNGYAVGKKGLSVNVKEK